MSNLKTSITETNNDDFPAHKDALNPVDHISKFLGLAVAQLYFFVHLLQHMKLFQDIYLTHLLNGFLKL